MRTGTRLYTKDGRCIGNAIVIKNCLTEYSEYNLIKTDFGNTMKLTDKEINEFFYTSQDDLFPIYEDSVFQWMFDKAKLFFKMK